MNFYGSHPIALQKLSNEHSYKFSCILTLTEVTSIRFPTLSIFIGAILLPFKNWPIIILVRIIEF